MVIGDILQTLSKDLFDRTPPMRCDVCSHSVTDPSAWKRETYTGSGASVLDICPQCENTIHTYYCPN